MINICADWSCNNCLAAPSRGQDYVTTYTRWQKKFVQQKHLLLTF